MRWFYSVRSPVPLWTRTEARNRIVGDLDTPDWNATRSGASVRSAASRIIAYMGTAGYYPLVHSYEGKEPNYAFRARGVEDLDTPRSPHRLPDRAATIRPHAAFASSHDGRRDAQDICPDVTAFVFLENRPHWGRRSATGPRVFAIDRIVQKLVDTGNQRALGTLCQSLFGIAPAGLTGQRWGAVDHIPLISCEGGKPTSIHIATHRHQCASSGERRPEAEEALRILDEKIQAMCNADEAPRVNLHRGDVLLVNNRRAATAWEAKCTVKYWLGAHHREENLKHGDRVIVQIDFYRPNSTGDAPQAGLQRQAELVLTACLLRSFANLPINGGGN